MFDSFTEDGSGRIRGLKKRENPRIGLSNHNISRNLWGYVTLGFHSVNKIIFISRALSFCFGVYSN